MTSTPPETRQPCRWRRLAVLTLGHFLVDMYGGYLAPLIPALALHLHRSDADLTFMVGMAGILVNAVQPLAGAIVHRLRTPILLWIGPLLALGYCLLGNVPSYALLMGVVLIASFGVGIFHPEGLMGAHAVSGDKETIGVPVFLSGGFFGFSFGALVSTQWVYYFGFNTLWLTALPAIFYLILLRGARMQEVRQVDDTPAAAASQAQTATAPIPFYAVLTIGTLLATAVTFLFTFLNVYLTQQMATEGIIWGGRALFLIGVASALGSYAWGYLAHRYNGFSLLAGIHWLYVPSLVLVLDMQNPLWLMTLAGMAGVIHGGAFFPIIATWARRASGLTAGLRAGLIVGGSWGIGALIMMGAGELMRRGVGAYTILLSTLPMTLLASALSACLARRMKQDASVCQ